LFYWFSIIGNTSKQLDALYLADGPWDWTIWKKEVTITSYDIDNDVNDAIITDDIHRERNTSVTGEIYGTLNVFRNVLPGYFWCEFLFNAGLCNSKPLPVEVILVTENTSDWNNRLVQISANTNLTEINILW
jgi:hypothetical protein